MDWQEMYDLLLESELVSEEALGIACAIGGCNEETMERVLFYKTGWKTFEGWLDDMTEED